MAEKEAKIGLAKIAEQAERYDDMANAMKEVTVAGNALTSEERNLLSVAYKNVVGARRSAWRVIASLEKKDVEDQKQLTSAYRKEIEAELQETCKEVLDLLGEHLLPSAEQREDNKEEITFYLKMKGDYHRYLAEVASDEKREAAVQDAKVAYEKATEEAASLAPTHPIRLGLALNYSVFHYEINNQAQAACELATKAFNEAIAEIDSLKEESYKDSTLIMQLLRDNLTLWSVDDEEQDQEES